MKILLVDDDVRVYNLLKAYMSSDEHLVHCTRPQQALELMQHQAIALVLMDIQLDGDNGLEFFSQHKDEFLSKNIPVIFLSQIGDLKAKLEAFQFGAQDYVVKPFEPLELVARIRSKIKLQSESSSSFRKGDLVFDLKANVLSVVVGDSKCLIDLSATEFKLMYFLARNQGQIFSRAQLLDQVWGNNLHVTDRTVDQHISKLRKKVKSSAYTIKTCFNTGYSFEPL